MPTAIAEARRHESSHEYLRSQTSFAPRPFFSAVSRLAAGQRILLLSLLLAALWCWLSCSAPFHERAICTGVVAFQIESIQVSSLWRFRNAYCSPSTDDVDGKHGCRIAARLPRMIAAGVLLGLICGAAKRSPTACPSHPCPVPSVLTANQRPGALIVLHPKGGPRRWLRRRVPKSKLTAHSISPRTTAATACRRGVRRDDHLVPTHQTRWRGEGRPQRAANKFANPKTSPVGSARCRRGATFHR